MAQVFTDLGSTSVEAGTSSGNHTFQKRKCKAVKMCLDTSGDVLTQLDLTDAVTGTHYTYHLI